MIRSIIASVRRRDLVPLVIEDVSSDFDAVSTALEELRVTAANS